MKRFLIAAMSLTLAMPAIAQQVSPSQLQSQLNQAMCAQNWSSAIANIDALIAVGLDSASTQNLQSLRSQVVEIQSSGQTFASMPGWNCGGSSLNWDRAAGAVTTRSGASSGVRARPTAEVNRTVPVESRSWGTGDGQGFLEYYGRYGLATVAANRALGDAYAYCDRRLVMSRGDALAWASENITAGSSPQRERDLDHWAIVTVGADEFICP